mmetsp:Transcript_5049/g.9705  ORF Transcript_5049/g.9705 Transcript_5049/m.9705 type:complete len:137 (-) Transcript_5049:77-487(-)|eukprot:CAMPEP_0172699430 /NCGR_PEP_ID=MMETSP1074-20121228/30184_1 /TAXON_ID=2916 /ORGANISM="Ceratium fusus, Strain PA161109" /LENGTH=136 /DNA_ID=CAMNT_0013520631 /DNA_START=70 /DNA_END=480 /DNA_ORIENTATION=-
MAPQSQRLEPPAAPVRKPSDADVEVPPMEELPLGPRKRCPSTDVGSSSGREEDGSEEPNFDWDDEDESNYQVELVGFDDEVQDTTARPCMRRPRANTAGLNTTLTPGASPMLLTALERLAAEAGSHSGARIRADTF